MPTLADDAHSKRMHHNIESDDMSSVKCIVELHSSSNQLEYSQHILHATFGQFSPLAIRSVVPHRISEGVRDFSIAAS